MTNLIRVFSLQDMPTSGLFHHSDPTASLYMQRGIQTTLYQARGEITVNEDSQTVNQRCKASFRVPQNYHLLGPIVFRGTFDALGGDAVDGVSVLKNRLINNAARLQIREIRMRAGQTAKTGIIIPGKLLTVEHYIQTTMRDREALELMELGGMTPTQRNNAALSTQYFEVELLTPFDVDYDQFLQIHTLQDELIVEIFFEDDDIIRDYDGATSYQITRSDLSLLCDVRIISQEESNFIMEPILEEEGLLIYKRDLKWDERTFSSSDLSNTDQLIFPVHTFNVEIACWFVTLRYADELEPDNNTGYDNLQTWHSHWFRDGNNQLIEAVEYQHQVYRLNRQYVYYPVALNAIIHSNAKNITMRQTISGSHNIAGFTRGEIVIRVDSDMLTEMNTNGRSVVIECCALTHNYIQMAARNRGPDMQANPMVSFSEYFTM